MFGILYDIGANGYVVITEFILQQRSLSGYNGMYSSYLVQTSQLTSKGSRASAVYPSCFKLFWCYLPLVVDFFGVDLLLLPSVVLVLLVDLVLVTVSLALVVGVFGLLVFIARLIRL